eukprot:TRINITY_DN13523_c0_g5_i1.p1 TRINITY_DN13523_c0_g5~~TRINITY_DN13523_c0_g5_i1.p1  ORF type:complete len:1755 (+),score=575.37 TRINITY_DN13523_c0_g5_i1:63-5327(+)
MSAVGAIKSERTDLVWLPHESDVFVPGWLLKHDGDKKIYGTDSGETIELPASEVLEPVSADNVLLGVNDVCTLDQITPATLLHSVRTRYERDDIYTNITRILVAVNPFKPLDIYEDQYLEQYRNASDAASLPPHIFGIAADVFSSLSTGGGSQAVLISGESGAGKTESTKLVLLYMSSAFGSMGGGCDDGFEDKLLEINPILEAFGNAKTVRNNNSSRFGKWIEVSVRPDQMRVAAASVTDYLLEVTRVCAQGPGERNYHIFYQLARDTSGEYDDLNLAGKADSFNYLKANAIEDPGVDDALSFDMLRKAFSSLAFEVDEQEEVFSIVAGILHLGNVTFTPDEHDTKVDADGQKALEEAARLFDCDAAALSKCMCMKRLTVGKDVTFSPVGGTQAAQARDSMAKLVYKRLFKWIVSRCNDSLGEKIKATVSRWNSCDLPFIGVLDIAGFESFEINSLEQLFINLSNEKLQQFFNDYVFKSELSEYSAEGIEIGQINYADNADILHLVEGRGGLLALLDDCTTGLRQTDVDYASKSSKEHEKHAHFIKPKFPNQPIFGIRHFAGDVTYTTTGFLEKNVAQEPPEVIELLKTSGLEVLQELGEAVEGDEEPQPQQGAARASIKHGIKRATVSSKFRKSLQLLIDKFGPARAHFIRCLKPNMAKVPSAFDSKMVLEQLRLSGVMEAVKIRKAGFPFRQSAQDYLKRYYIILPRSQRMQICLDSGYAKDDPVRSMLRKSEDGDAIKAAKDLTAALSELFIGKFQASNLAIGKTKVFIRDATHKVLEQYRRLALIQPAVIVQAALRGNQTRQTMKKVKELRTKLLRILASVGMPERGDLQISVIEQQKRVTVVEGTAADLAAVLTQMDDLSIDLPIRQQGLKLQARLNAEAKLTRQMMACDSCSDVTAIEALLSRAAAFKMKGDIVDQAHARLDSLRKELQHVAMLRDCPHLGLEDIEKIVETAVADGLDKETSWTSPDGFPLFEAAVARRDALRAERQAMIDEAARLAAEEEARQFAAANAEEKKGKVKEVQGKIAKAMAEYNVPALSEALQEAKELGTAVADYSEAQEAFLQLQDGEFCQRKFTELRSADVPEKQLMLANLVRQMTALGVKVRATADSMREVTQSMVRKSITRQKSLVLGEGLEREVAQTCFTDLSNFSQLRDPVQWSHKHKGPMLEFGPERIMESLTKLDDVLAPLAVRNFGNLLRCMGDKPSIYMSSKEQPILQLAVRTPMLVDEIYLQILKQLTKNHSAQSAKKGWSLLIQLCKVATPSSEMAEFVRAFLKEAMTTASKPSGKADGQGDALPRATSNTLGRELRRRASSGRLITKAIERRKSAMDLSVQLILEEKPKLAGEALEGFEASFAKSAAQSAASQSAAGALDLIEVRTEDGQCHFLKAKPDWTVTTLHQRMQKVLSLPSAAVFEFFAHDPEDFRPPWRMLDRSANALDTAAKVVEQTRQLVFARLNISCEEMLAFDDVAVVRCTYDHAVKQFLCYAAPTAEDTTAADSPITEIAAALVCADKATYRKTRKGHDRFNKRVEQLKAEVDAGLTGDHVLERYVPPSWLRSRNARGAVAKEVVDCMAERAKFADASELILKGRALSLMQVKLQDFDAYCFHDVKLVDKGSIQWSGVEWTAASSSGAAAAGGHAGSTSEDLEKPPTGAVFELLVHRHCIELRPKEGGATFAIPLQRGPERRSLTGFQALPDCRLALRLSVWEEVASSIGGAYTSKGLALQLKEDGAEAAAGLAALMSAILRLP